MSRLRLFSSPACFRGVLSLLICSTLPMPQASAGGRKRDPTVTVQFHVQTNSLDSNFAQEVTLDNPTRKIYVEKLASISERDIVAFYPMKGTDGKTFGAEFQLDQGGTMTLSNLSVGHRGGVLLAVVNGLVIAPLIIDKQISDGIIVIPYGLSEAQIRGMGESFPLIGNPPGSKPGKLPKGGSI